MRRMETHRFTARDDGSLVVTATAALPPYPERLTAHLTRHAAGSWSGAGKAAPSP